MISPQPTNEEDGCPSESFWAGTMLPCAGGPENVPSMGDPRSLTTMPCCLASFCALREALRWPDPWHTPQSLPLYFLVALLYLNPLPLHFQQISSRVDGEVSKVVSIQGTGVLFGADCLLFTLHFSPFSFTRSHTARPRRQVSASTLPGIL